jgi:hypothetical protein
MEAVTLILLIVVSLVGLDFAAIAWGADSREPVGDDHARS